MKAAAENHQRATGLGAVSVEISLIAAISIACFAVISIYADSLRDPRFLDGWLVAGIVTFQVLFHVALKAMRLSPRTARRWRKLHTFAGMLLIPVFFLHTNASRPESGFEWALWLALVIVSLSGLLVSYLGWLLNTRAWSDERLSLESIPARCADLANKAQAAIATREPLEPAAPLPAIPDEDWIKDLSATHLEPYFAHKRTVFTGVAGSARLRRSTIKEIERVAVYLDADGRDRLEALKTLVIEKDALESARVLQRLNRACLMVHVPLTYALVMLAVVHGLTVYAFSSGTW